MDLYYGLGASSGIGMGCAYVIPDRAIVVEDIECDKENIDLQKAHEWERLNTAFNTVLQSIRLSLKAAEDAHDNTGADILRTHELMLCDTVFLDELHKEFIDSTAPIAHTLWQRVLRDADTLRHAGSDYLMQRATDIIDVFSRVHDELLGRGQLNLEDVPQGAVVVAQSLSPEDVLLLGRKKIAGILLSTGGKSSHVAILANNYKIPAIFALDKIQERVSTGDMVIVDASGACAIISPDDTTLALYKDKSERAYIQSLELKEYATKEAHTKDNMLFKLYANIGTLDDAKIALEEGADGIGLFRTEFLFMGGNKEAPISLFDEEGQFKVYSEVLRLLSPRPVTIRTLDAGGDKALALKELGLSTKEENPLLGLRAIRVGLKYPKILRAQLRALYRASVYGNLRIMLPLVTSVDQVEKVRAMIAGIQEELKEAAIPYNERVPVGIMIETPAAAIMADALSRVCDFFSIGTNDLTQYTLGVDRENAGVSAMYDEYNLSVLRLIQWTRHKGERANIEVSVCGQMATQVQSALVLGGIGLTHLSMNPRDITKVKAALSQKTVAELKDIARKLLEY